jgi:hypothetical protein
VESLRLAVRIAPTYSWGELPVLELNGILGTGFLCMPITVASRTGPIRNSRVMGDFMYGAIQEDLR